MIVIDTIIIFVVLFVLPSIAGGIEQDLIGLADGAKLMFGILFVIIVVRLIAQKLHDLFEQIK